MKLQCFGGPWCGQYYDLPDTQEYIVLPLAPVLSKGWPKKREAYYKRDRENGRLKWVEPRPEQAT